jgi:hypothetical protein
MREPTVKAAPVFKSRLRRLSIVDLERMSPAQRQRREPDEARSARHGSTSTASDADNPRSS